MPPLLVEAAVGIFVAVAIVAVRISLGQFTGDRAPYALNFLAVVIATLVAGWRAGALALFISQLLIWYAVVPEHWSFAFRSAEISAAFLVATISEAAILLVMALYQREIDKGTAERERRMELLGHALNEIDHRTRNNYQTVLALIDLQARRSEHDGIRDALRQISERIQAVANASQQLASRSGDLEAVRLDDHLCGLVAQIGRGLSREEIEVECNVDDVTASPDKATSISIIVNELVTNAIKHAFNGEGSGHVSVIGKSGSKFELIVTDDGKGMSGTRRDGHSGLGTKLVESFTRQLGAAHEVVSTEQGTTHRLLIPNLN